MASLSGLLIPPFMPARVAWSHGSSFADNWPEESASAFVPPAGRDVFLHAIVSSNQPFVRLVPQNDSVSIQPEDSNVRAKRKQALLPFLGALFHVGHSSAMNVFTRRQAVSCIFCPGFTALLARKLYRSLGWVIGGDRSDAFKGALFGPF